MAKKIYINIVEFSKQENLNDVHKKDVCARFDHEILKTVEEWYKVLTQK